MVGVRGQLRLESLCADVRSILIPNAVGEESFVRNVQSEFAFGARLAHLKRVFPREQLCLEAEVLDNGFVAHLAPGTYTRELSEGAGVTGFTRLARRRLGGTPSAGSTAIRLVTNSLIPCESKSIVVRSESYLTMTPQPYRKCLI